MADQKTNKTRLKHTVKAEVTPFYNMGVTVSPQGAQADVIPAIVDGNQPEIFGKTADLKHWKYPRKLDNVRMVKTEDGTDLPIIHSVPCTGEVAQLDWVTFALGVETFGNCYNGLDINDSEAFDELADDLNQELHEIFGFGIAKKRDKGMHFYKYSWELEDNLGMVLMGHSSKRVAVQLNGTGCALAARGWQERLYRFLTEYAQRPKLTRVDLAHDDFEGRHLNVDWANMQDGLGGFWCGGTMPNIGHLGNWKRITGKGRTLTIGTRESGKFCRIYEKGKKEGAKDDPWTRAEVEFKGHDRFIPFDILLSPSPYFLGAYPCFADFDQYAIPEKIATVKKTAVITQQRAKEIIKHQFGKYFALFRKVYSDSEIMEFITANDPDAVPKRLQIIDHLAISIERNKQFDKAYSYTRFAQAVQRSNFDAVYS
ncbi:replication initiation factor domain-containing protein [Alkanindiges sp. WGS2144]|uniref:replication initiation factor domain-containing protein n=1 Tax=Alkanindiges sp. WGS2144 TaxID=3366808 RepID=UPI00374FF29B